MSVQTEITRIQGHVDEQADLIAQCKTALQGKVGGSGEDVTTETNAYTTELAELTTAVTALEEELAGKAAGGGGAVETCTVEVNSSYGQLNGIFATIADNSGNISPFSFSFGNNVTSYRLENVVCNSFLVIYFQSYGECSYINCESATHGMSSVNDKGIFITASQGETATITNSYNPYG